MESVEQAINNLYVKNDEFTSKQIKHITNTIYNVASKSISSSANLDKQFEKYFPEINNLGMETEKFNLIFCIEFKDDKH